MYTASRRNVLGWSLGLGVLATIALASPAAQAQTGGLEVRGTELLPQFILPEGAIFTFQLFENGRRVGEGLVQVDHDAVLPEGDGDCVPVFGGQFLFRYKWFLVQGRVTGGEVCATEDPDLYEVSLNLETIHGGQLCFEGILDHRPLNQRPPRLPKITGALFECPL
jgi:hypothetical protein